MAWSQSRKCAGTIKDHLWGILNAVVFEVSNGPAEGLNSRIKMIKVRGRGFRRQTPIHELIRGSLVFLW
ncbi:transposase [Candidatus Vondammii sp. HM_W22]|uniref:transposase n=1 Tax=Candidatus Vondammii sp. HM_W22 TaxID=2687299 RepID=UPI002A4E252C|nr:transposase [Candidatus Vondammii sp. HM_W22]